MKKLLLTLAVALVAVGAHAQFNLGNLLGGNKGGGVDASSLGSAISGLVEGVFSNDKLAVADLQGSWKYQAPAVSFKSDNLLQKAGGAAVASTVEGKLAPYYRTAGITSMKLDIAEDGTFSMKVKALTLSGTIEEAPEGSQANFVFHFRAVGSFNVGSLNAYVTKSGANTMSLMFDVSKLVALVKTAGKISGNSTVQQLTTLLESYDGICAGFKLKK